MTAIFSQHDAEFPLDVDLRPFYIFNNFLNSQN